MLLNNNNAHQLESRIDTTKTNVGAYPETESLPVAMGKRYVERGESWRMDVPLGLTSRMGEIGTN